MTYDNLLEDVIDFVAEYGQPECVKICNKRISWERFVELADKTNYDAGYGIPEIEGSLMLMWKDKVAIRATYDGAEWFEIIDISIPAEDISDVVDDLHRDADWKEEHGLKGSYPVGGW